MTAWWSGSAGSFLDLAPASLVAMLSHRALAGFRVNEASQLRAWIRQIAILRATLLDLPDVGEWRVLLEFAIPRLGGRIDAILLSPRAIFVIEFKIGASRFETADRVQLDAYALDLQDFHAGCRRHPILPVLVATEAPPPAPRLPLLLAGAASLMEANAETLPGLIRLLDRQLPGTGSPLDAVAWEGAAYRPVPNVIDAACLLYAGHGVAEIASARADAGNLTITADRIAALLAAARVARARLVLFVTGIPGAGKTLCGLNVAFAGRASQATFLTGNPTLVHVLREALVRSIADTPASRRLAAHRMEGVIQALPRFRDLYVQRTDEVPPERIVVIDEAQRSWTAQHAVAKTRDRPVRLDRSEPAHLLDIMARHDGFAAIVCLIGNGQEIHDGEGGLAAWGAALSERPDWQVHAAPEVLLDPEPRNRLPALRGMQPEPALHLAVPVRSLRHDATPRWVDAVLRGDAARGPRPAASSAPRAQCRSA